MEAMAAVFGGCQSLHTNSKDEALALPTESSVKIALRTQQIIAYESGIADTVDAFAGSYYIEYLTDEIEKKVWEYLEKIESMGGAVKCIEKGYQQEEIGRSAYEYEMALERKDKTQVGVNSFIQEEDLENINLLRIDDAVQKNQIEKLNKVKSTRDNIKVETNLKKLREAAVGSVNIIPYILSCVESYCTIGEISNILRDTWGEYR